MNIAGRSIGPGHPPFVVAELSGEHKGQLANALALIAAAKNAGADAAKLQVFDWVTLANRRGGRDKIIDWQGESVTLGELYQRTRTPVRWLEELFGHARDLGITLFASVFDGRSYHLDFLRRLRCPAYKIASREADYVGLVVSAAKTGKPLIISTGTATDEQLGRSIAEAAKCTNQIALLYCVSQYPAPIESIEFDQIGVLRHRYGLPVGFSDHTTGIEAAVKAVKAGASIIEKHITLDRKNGGPDAPFSLEPAEFAKMVQDVRDAYASLGIGERPKSEAPYRELRRRG